LRCRPRCGRGMVGGAGGAPRRSTAGNFKRITFSMLRKRACSAASQREIAVPRRRPARCGRSGGHRTPPLRKLEIDDMGDAVDVDARAAMSVATMARAWPLRNASSERSLWPWLFVAVDRAGRDPVAFKMLGHLVGAAFGSREDDRPGHFRIGEKLDEEIALAACLNKQDPVVDSVGGFRAGVTDTRWDRREARPRARQFRLASSREKKFCRRFGRVLAIRRMAFTKRGRACDRPRRGRKFRSRQGAPPGYRGDLRDGQGRDQNVEATREGLNLRTMRHAAEDNGSGEEGPRQDSGSSRDLTRQFACRTQNQHAAAIARAARLCVAR